MIRLLIFDLDGTLIDTSKDITEALNHALRPFGYPPLTEDRTRKLVGDGISRLIEKVIGEGKEEFEKIRDGFLEYYSKHIADHSVPYPHVVETLKMLEGYKKAVVTNKREELARDLLKRLGMIGFFDMVVGPDTAGKSKPSAAPVLYVLEQLGVDATEALMIGDGPTDIKAAHGAGVSAVAVGYGYKSEEELREADFFMKESIKELPALLEKLNSGR